MVLPYPRVMVICWSLLWFIGIGRTVGCFPPLAACMVPLDTMRALDTMREEAFKSVLALGPESEVHGVLINSKLVRVVQESLNNPL